MARPDRSGYGWAMAASRPAPDRLVLVTGANGFIASHIVASLLAVGARVRGTVRDLARRPAYEHLLGLPGAADRLELVEAHLLVPGAFDTAVAGVSGVIHTASPYVLTVADPQRDLVDPAVNGTLNVLRAASSSPSVRRVVVTSSGAAVVDEPVTGHVYTEADWNTRSTLARNPYYFSKTAAERAAWAFVAAEGPAFDLVAVNPFSVVGPALGPGMNTSVASIYHLMAGSFPALFRLGWAFVDVRDVADAHIRALTTPSASGRYLCAAQVLTMREAAAILGRVAGPGNRVPRLGLEHRLGTLLATLAIRRQPPGERSYFQTHLGRDLAVDASRIQRELGVTFRPVAETLLDTVADLRARGQMA